MRAGRSIAWPESSRAHRRPAVGGYPALCAERQGGIPLALLAPPMGTSAATSEGSGECGKEEDALSPGLRRPEVDGYRLQLQADRRYVFQKRKFPLPASASISRFYLLSTDYFSIGLAGFGEFFRFGLPIQIYI